MEQIKKYIADIDLGCCYSYALWLANQLCRRKVTMTLHKDLMEKGRKHILMNSFLRSIFSGLRSRLIRATTCAMNILL